MPEVDNRKIALHQLIKDVCAAAEPTRELFYRAFAALFPYEAGEDFNEFKHDWIELVKLEAYDQLAIDLLFPGYDFAINYQKGWRYVSCVVWIGATEELMRAVSNRAATPALAMLACALELVEDDNA